MAAQPDGTHAEPAEGPGARASPDEPFRRTLGVWSTAAILVGIIIGSGIFYTPAPIAAEVGSAGGVLAAWITGGLIALCGAFCLMELAAAWPETGGNFIFLSRSYHPLVGFLFSWTTLLIIRPGSIATMSALFADYLADVVPGEMGRTFHSVSAVGVVLLVTAINVAGIGTASLVQNLTTVAKCLILLLFIGVGGVFLLGVLDPHPTALNPPPAEPATALAGLGVALVTVLWTFGGWEESPYVAGEVRDPARNIPRAILFGLSGVIVLYLLTNLAYLAVLGHDGMARAPLIAASFMERALGPGWPTAVSLFVLISTLGALNGLVLTAGRLGYATGRRHRVAGFLGRVSPATRTPVRALVFEAALAVGAIVFFQAQFEALLAYTSFVYWIFMGLLGGAVFLRRRRTTPSPVRAWGYPVTPTLFMAGAAFMVVSLIVHEPGISGFGGLIVAVGAAVHALGGQARQ